MARKTLFLFFFLFFLILAQSSFFPHFLIRGISFNFFLLAIVLVCLFAQDRNFALFSALIGGLYLDIYSFSGIGFFGMYTASLLCLAFFLRLVIRKYVQLPIFK